MHILSRRLYAPATAAALLSCATLATGAHSATIRPSAPTSGPATSDVTFRWSRSYAIGGQTINIFVGPPAGSGGISLISGVGGNLWYAIYTDRTYHPSPEIISFSPKTHKANLYPQSGGLPLSGQYPIVGGVTPDGSHVWFTENNNAPFAYGDVNAAGNFQQFLPSGLSGNAFYGTTGPDKLLWFGYTNGGYVSADLNGNATLYNLPGAPYEDINDLTVGPDGYVWYANNGSNNSGKGIGKILPSTGAPTEYSISSGANGITAGPDGRMWFCANNASVIGSISTGGQGLTTFTNGISATPVNIVTGPDKSLYFSEYNSSNQLAAVARITTAGKVTEYALPYGFVPHGIAVGSDKNIWVVDTNHDQLGELVLKK